MQFTKFMSIVLVAALAFCCNTSYAALEDATGDLTALGGLGGLVSGLLGTVLGLLFHPTGFSMVGNQIMANGKCTISGVPGAQDMSGDCSIPMQSITVDNSTGKCALVDLLLQALHLNLLGINVDIPEGLILNVTGDQVYLLGALLCKLLGPGSAGLLTNLDGSQLSLITNLLNNLL